MCNTEAIKNVSIARIAAVSFAVANMLYIVCVYMCSMAR